MPGPQRPFTAPPFTPAGWPGHQSGDGPDPFKWEAVNYAPLTLVFIAAIGLWWRFSAKNWFTGPIREIELPDATGRIPEEGAPTAGI